MSASASLPMPTAEALGSRRTIPFDYSFHFDLDGEPGKSYTQTITISIEAAFTAISIGYGVIPTIEALEFGPEQLGDLTAAAAPTPVRASVVSNPRLIDLPVGALTPITTARTSLETSLSIAIGDALKRSKLGIATPLEAFTQQSREVLVGSPMDLTLGDLVRALARKLGEEQLTTMGEIGPETQAALLNGIQLNPEIANIFLATGGNASLDASQFARLFRTIGAPPDRVLFLYALRDEGTGREFQSEPVLNIAGLGIADGDRPFRHFALPISFAPRSNIRLDVIEKSEFRGELFVSLHGYKVLGGTGTPTGRALSHRRRNR